MRKLLMALTASLALLAGVAEAHGPSRQKTTQEVTLNATPDAVWAVIGNYNDLSWYPGVAAVDAPAGNTKDGTRTVTLDNGTVLTEELTKYDATKRIMAFRRTADDVVLLPATNFSTVMTVKDVDGKALVEFRGAYYRGFPNNNPPPDLSDEAATAAVNAFYQVGIAALTEKFGAAK